MKNDSFPNHYEQAFENWLIDNQIRYTSIDEHKQPTFINGKIKSFDFLVYPPNKPIIIAEVKGRKFTGTSLEKMAGFECWVTAEDIDGLVKWQEILGPAYQAVFVFVYLIKNIDVDFNGVDVFDFSADRYVFFTVKLEDYCSSIKRRSPKWQTVTLPADKFRQFAIQISEFLL
jgi:hypothetical protein